MAQVLGVNPMKTTTAAGSFHVQSAGWYQGVALDDPAARFALCSGYLDPSETSVLWGGVAISELVPGSAQLPLGAKVRRATSVENMTGFSVFNQAHNGLTSSQSPVPVFLQNMSVSFYRFGSGARVPLKASAALVAEFGAGNVNVNTGVVWNFATSELDLFGTIGADVATTALVFANGVATATTENAHGLTVGAVVTISGAVPTQFNGTVQVASVPTATTFTYVPVATPAPTTATTQGTIGAADAAGNTLPVKIIGIKEGNCKTVVYDATDSLATWNENSSCALVLL